MKTDKSQIERMQDAELAVETEESWRELGFGARPMRAYARVGNTEIGAQGSEAGVLALATIVVGVFAFFARRGSSKGNTTAWEAARSAREQIRANSRDPFDTPEMRKILEETASMDPDERLRIILDALSRVKGDA